MFKVTWNTNIPEYATSLHTALRGASEDGALYIGLLAKSYVRKDTGSLEESIDIERMDDRKVSVNAGNISGGYLGGSLHNDKPAGVPIDYAIDQEYGLSGTPSTPYMTPAAEQGFGYFVQRTTERINQATGATK